MRQHGPDNDHHHCPNDIHHRNATCGAVNEISPTAVIPAMSPQNAPIARARFAHRQQEDSEN
jgi:hypothetical protein